MMIQFQNIPWLPALVVAVYLFQKKKSAGEIVENVIKTMIGYYLIVIGAELSAMALTPLDEQMFQSFGSHSGVLNTEIFGSLLLRECGNWGMLAFLLAFLVNVILARGTKKGYLFLTGHHLFFLSLMSFSLLGRILMWPGAALAAGVFTGVYAYVSVRMSARCMEKLNPSSPASLANSATGAAFIGIGAGRLLRRRKHIAYYDKSGKNAGNVTSMGVLTVWGAYLVLLFCSRSNAGLDGVKEGFVLAAIYGAALTLIILGIRMLLGVIIQMFWDVGKKMVPNLVVGLDATAVVSYSPRAWRAGFLAAAVTGTLTTLLCLLFRAPFIPLPGYTSLYFAGGVAGVFGNAEGGKRGAVVAGAAVGAAVILLMSLFMTYAGCYSGSGAVLGETEYGILGCIVLLIVKILNMLM